MAVYDVAFKINAVQIKSLRKRLETFFEKDQVTLQIKKQKKNVSRADRFSEAEGLVGDAKSIVEELHEEMENWKDSIPENLQGGNKYSEVEDAVDALQQIQDDLENITFDVSFPGMF